MHQSLKNLYKIAEKYKKPKKRRNNSIRKYLKSLWYIATNLRNPQMLLGYLQTAKELENEPWNNVTKRKFQKLLIKNRLYLLPESSQSFNKLSPEQKRLLRDDTIEMTFEQAEAIFNTKCYSKSESRGEFSLMPLVRLGFVMPSKKRNKNRCNTNYVTITDVGNQILSGKYNIKDILLEQLLKIQIPSVLENRYKIHWHVRPFVCVLRLIKRINELCKERGLKEKGITVVEFGIFALSIDDYRYVDEIAERVLEFRAEYESRKTTAEKDLYRKEYILKYLAGFCNPLINTNEYANVIINYMRYLGFIRLRGKFGYACVDLSPLRKIEIAVLLEKDNGQDIVMPGKKWLEYFTTYGTYELPWDTVEYLQKILQNLVKIANELEDKLNIKHTEIFISSIKQELKDKTNELREYILSLKETSTNIDYTQDISKIDEVIERLKRVRYSEKEIGISPALAMEKWTALALTVMDNFISINPNYIKGYDGEAIFTAPKGVPDIEGFYEDYNIVCEVTTQTSCEQWYKEGQPVMRHVRSFEDQHLDKICYGLFVAPSLHMDAINTFYMSITHPRGFQGKLMKLIPITINQLIDILQIVKVFKETHKKLTHRDLKDFYDKVIDAAFDSDSLEWANKIPKILEEWKISLLNKEEKVLALC